MYLPPHFRAEPDELIAKVIQENPFATLITPSAEGLKITHMPILYDLGRGEHGTVRAHMAKANPHWKSFETESESVLIVMGPHAYVSSTWYEPDTRVSTWNYAAIHLHGRPQPLDREHCLRFLEDLVDAFEPKEGAYDMEAGRQAMEKQVDGVVAFEMPVDRIEAKFKLSQNRKTEDRKRVIANLSDRFVELAGLMSLAGNSGSE